MKESQLVRIMTVFAVISAAAFCITVLKFSPGNDYPLTAAKFEQIIDENTQKNEILTDERYINMKEYVISEEERQEMESTSGAKVPSAPSQPAAVPQGQFPMEINSAGKEDLMQVKGIGEKRAQDILDYKKRKGRIKDMEELLEIRGIGEKTLMKIKEKFYAA